MPEESVLYHQKAFPEASSGPGPVPNTRDTNESEEDLSILLSSHINKGSCRSGDRGQDKLQSSTEKEVMRTTSFQVHHLPKCMAHGSLGGPYSTMTYHTNNLNSHYHMAFMPHYVYTYVWHGRSSL